jgi:hypothetical protein
MGYTPIMLAATCAAADDSIADGGVTVHFS